MTVVVPTRDRPALLFSCLDALRQELEDDDELIVVDSASTDPRVGETVRQFGARLVRRDRPGASLARNSGWREGCNDVVAFIDDDVRVAPGWRKAADAAMSAVPSLAFVTGRLEAPEGEAATPHPVALQTELVPSVIDRNTVVSAGHGANVLIRRAALERTRGFDEEFGPGATFRAAEDEDLLDRLLEAGYVGRYEPDLLAYHVQWRDRRQLLGVEWSYGFGMGARLVKIARIDRHRARKLAVEAVWSWTLKSVPHDLVNGYQFGVAYSVVRFAGMVAGALRVVGVPLENGHLTSRARRAGRRRRAPS
jgi:glycosyltransferase involved in cell wall biosynthesis